MSTITRTRRFLASLGAVTAVAGAVVAGAPVAQAAPAAQTTQTTQAGACDFSPSVKGMTAVNNGSGVGALDLYHGVEVNGQPIIVWTANQSPAQTWTFWTYCDGTTAISHGQGKVIDLDTGSGAVRLWDTPGGLDGLNQPNGDWMPANQKWLLTDNDRGWYLIHSAAVGQCLTSNGAGRTIGMTACDTADPAQRWLLG
ncbi:RICIN domain-containing protein [Kitasatospora sp. NPDC058444]|uniref:RICIN domain-containing protein n=1 Tax=Kitasatospora sp. NPDC058444 TaxID=3346504 RepID=UPI00366896E5